uniref:EF-hand domain-containing protein n=1 Tax=Plectus sambesii TaxID=2011161 RepID=A0A914VVB0_9BILA
MVVIVETIACSEAATTSTATTSTAQPVTAGSSHSPTETLTKPVVPPSHFYQLPAEKEAKLRTIYNRLDVDKDGTVDIRDLSLALKEIPHIPDKYLP